MTNETTPTENGAADVAMLAAIQNDTTASTSETAAAPEAAAEPMVDKTLRVAEGLSDLLDGLEYHYPGEVNEDNVEEILSVLRDHGMDLPVVAAGLHTDPTYSLGAFINPDDSLRRQGIDTLKRGVDLCGQTGASFII